MSSSGVAGKMLAGEWRVLKESSIQTDFIVISICRVDLKNPVATFTRREEKAQVDFGPDPVFLHCIGYIKVRGVSNILTSLMC